MTYAGVVVEFARIPVLISEGFWIIRLERVSVTEGLSQSAWDQTLRQCRAWHEFCMPQRSRIKSAFGQRPKVGMT